MSKQLLDNPRAAMILVGFVALVLVWPAVARESGSGRIASQNAQEPIKAIDAGISPSENVGIEQKASRFDYGSPNLNGATVEELGYFATKYADHHLKADGTSKVRMARYVTREQFTGLGFGCLADFASIEQPPLALVILQGRFDFRGSIPGSFGAPPPAQDRDYYVVYVFDVWSASLVSMSGSFDGALVKYALGDPTLPDLPPSSAPEVCPTQVPSSQKTTHYGQEAPAFDSPESALPSDIVITTPPTPSSEVTPESTQAVPGPMPTEIGYPTLVPAPPDPPTPAISPTANP